jgi:ribbon-helix-helix CopG family protein
MSLRESTGSGRVRVQLDLRVEEVRALDELRDRTGLRSRADAVRLSLGLFEWMTEQAGQGRRVLAVGDREVVHLAIPTTSLRVGVEIETDRKV